MTKSLFVDIKRFTSNVLKIYKNIQREGERESDKLWPSFLFAFIKFRFILLILLIYIYLIYI